MTILGGNSMDWRYIGDVVSDIQLLTVIFGDMTH